MGNGFQNTLGILNKRLSNIGNFHVVGKEWTLADICAFMFLTEIDPVLLNGNGDLKEYCDNIFNALFF